MTDAASAAFYTIRRVEKMLGISPSIIRSLIRVGFVTPVRGPRREYRFTFQDVILLKTAYSLQAANIPPRRVLRSLSRLSRSLPKELPLSGLRITAVGKEIAVRDGQSQWAAETGQLMMDFDVKASHGSVSIAPRPVRGAPAHDSADHWFAQGQALEATDRAAALEAYRKAVQADDNRANAYLNLGAILCEDGRFGEADALYVEALTLYPDEPLLRFNRAIALEDLERDEEAIAEYQQCLALAPELADAHYNLARLFERLERPQNALRHYSAYRRLKHHDHRG